MDELSVLLAGLLHDLGKVGQRAAVPSSRELSERYGGVGLAPLSYNGAPINTHVWWTAWWIEEQRDFYQDVLGLSAEGDNSLMRVSARHHRGWESLSAYERVIQLADRISAGMERTGLGDEETSTGRGGASSSHGSIYRGGSTTPRNGHREVPLMSLWAVLASRAAEGVTDCNPRASEYWGYPVGELDMHQAVFPRKYTGQFSDMSEAYQQVWEGFRTDHARIVDWLSHAGGNSGERFRSYIHTLLPLLHKYFWAVPSGTYGQSEPIVSLFDHLKTTACFAHCLFRWLEEEPSWRWLNCIGGRRNGQESGDEAPCSASEALKKLAGSHPFLLVGGDLKGIQRFVYSIYSSKAKVALKGRSFYLQLLAEIIIEKILRDPDISAWRTHVIFASGGRFYLVLPHTRKVVKALERLYEHLQRWLWKELHADLFVGMSWVPFGFYSVSNSQSNAHSGNDRVTDSEAVWKRVVTLQEADLVHLRRLKREMGAHPYADCSSSANQEFWEAWASSHELATLGDLWWLVAEKLGSLKFQSWGNVLVKAQQETGESNGVFNEMFVKTSSGGTVGAGSDELAICQVTGRMGHKGRELHPLAGEEDGLFVERHVYEQIELGRLLGRESMYIVLRPDPGDISSARENAPDARPRRAIVDIWGWRVFVLQNIAGHQLRAGDVVWVLNNPRDFLEQHILDANQPVSLSFYFYGGHRQPVKQLASGDERPATLLELSGVPARHQEDFMGELGAHEWAGDEIDEETLLSFGQALFGRLSEAEEEWAAYRAGCCGQSEEETNRIPSLYRSEGASQPAGWNVADELLEPMQSGESANFRTTYLATLRADVDRLGELFVFGLRPSDQSFSALSTLSWQLGWFFSGFINELQASDALTRQHMQIVYAGGDDVFAIGRWDAVLTFARRLRWWYLRFAACRSDVSLSAGVGLFRPKYPVQRAAFIAGKAEGQAKSYVHAGMTNGRLKKTKDAICVGDLPWGWTPCSTHPQLNERDEFGFIQALAGVMLKLLYQEELSTGFLHRLVGYVIRMEQQEQIVASVDDEALEFERPDEEQQEQSVALANTCYEFNRSDYRWLWHFIYNSGRMPGGPALATFIGYLRKLFWGGDRTRAVRPARAPLLVAEAARLALLYWRTFYSKVPVGERR